MLFPPVAQCQTVPTEVTRELIRALADLLLQALQVEPSAEGGSDDEHEDHR
jgi:hypothetical protein